MYISILLHIWGPSSIILFYIIAPSRERADQGHVPRTFYSPVGPRQQLRVRAASLGLDIVTNLAVEVLPAWFLQGLLSYSAVDHTCAVCRFIYRPGGLLPS